MQGVKQQMQTWDLWIPDAAATGVSFARGRLDATEVLLVHAPPEKLTVEVRDGGGALVARAQDLPRTMDSPMLRLRREGERITREDFWPSNADLGTPVLLPGGEVGILKAWWHASDLSEWRWQVEFYNHR
jgi:hypothetical protein